MSSQKVSVKRPQRWDAPFASDMTEETVAHLLSVEPFSLMTGDSFPKHAPLPGLLKNDCRIVTYEPGDIVIRQGDYGNSAFLVLDGDLLVTLQDLPKELLGRKKTEKMSWLNCLSQGWKNSRFAESRSRVRATESGTGIRNSGEQTRVFIQDIPGTIHLTQTHALNRGMLFGELAALNRTPRSATVIANTKSILLEMRWQGFRDLMKSDRGLREYVDHLYRKHSLRGHLRQTPELQNLPNENINALAKITRFESYGDFTWNRSFKKQSREDLAQRITMEPVIAEQNQPADDFIMIRNGFVRLSRQYGEGHRTVAYLGKGQTFGLREIAHNWRTDLKRGYTMSLRAVGHVDVLRIPAPEMEQWVLGSITEEQLPEMLAHEEHVPYRPQPERRLVSREQEIDTGLLEFLVEGRFINGTEAMLIDLDRCTRCDDCVRACASTHDNNPRFLRQGPQHENWMIAGACMHCVDPVCMIGCPTGAIARDKTTGNVLINDLTCIGCGVCANSCPYQNIRMVDVRDKKGNPLVDGTTQKPISKATKCDFCAEQSGGPACQRACPHDALFRVDLTTPNPLYQLTQGS
ncbi:MAG: cyclic nucleotide-binding domain-containing protein [Pirellulaceae bacterium]|nr:cyclic nucleotide-binding domain-containing protein [Pirellulaceae bacterium]